MKTVLFGIVGLLFVGIASAQVHAWGVARLMPLVPVHLGLSLWAVM